MKEINLDYFWEKCREWVDKFSLHEFWWMCEEVDETLTEGWGEVVIDRDTMTAYIRIKSDTFNQDNCKVIVDRIAFHEVCEVMLTVFTDNMSDTQREQARHSVLNKIAHAIGV